MRLRWTSAPKESDPANVQRDRRVFWPRTDLSRQKNPSDALFNRCLKAKKQHERARMERDSIRVQLKSHIAVEAKSANSDRRRMARGLKPESGAAKAKRAAQIEKAGRRLAKAEAALMTAHGEYLRLVGLWNETQ